MPTIPKGNKRPWIAETKRVPSEAYKNVYNTRRWRKLRDIQLSRQSFCKHCADKGDTTEAKHVDHIVPISQGGEPWALDNLQSLCHSHHTIKTNNEKSNRRTD